MPTNIIKLWAELSFMKKNILELLKINFALIFTSIVVGIIVSIVAQFFSFVANKVFNLIQSQDSYSFLYVEMFEFSFFPLLACMIAGLLIGLLIKVFGVTRWHGPADTIYAAHQKAGSLDTKSGFLSTIAAFFSISGGASVGIYGPLVHFGGTLGAFLRSRSFIPNIPHDIIIGSGVAAAISAGFSSPLAGIIFAHEVILRHFSMRALTAISLASVSASFLARWVNLVEPTFKFNEISFQFIQSIPGLIIVGFMSGFIAFIFMKSLLFFTKQANKIDLPFYYKPLFPALLCGVCGIFFPEVIGLGSETIKSVIIDNNTLLFLFMLLTFKIVLSSLCIGFGMFGGVLSPALLIGSCVGAMIYYVPLLGINENLSHILAVSGMAAVASSIIGGPITAVVLVLELTGSINMQYLIFLLRSVLNYLHDFGSSFFDAQLKSRNINIGFGREYIYMSQIQIKNLIDKNFLLFDKNISVNDALKLFKSKNVTEAYFRDEQGKFAGKVKVIDIFDKKNVKAILYKEKKVIKLKPDNTLLESIKILSNFVGESVPVVDKESLILGTISENEILKSYDEIAKDIKNIEKN